MKSELAEKLLTIEEIDNNWGSQLQEICDTQAYSNNFYRSFKNEREAILINNSVGLNEFEKLDLAAFFDEIYVVLSVL